MHCRMNKGIRSAWVSLQYRGTGYTVRCGHMVDGTLHLLAAFLSGHRPRGCHAEVPRVQPSRD